MNKGFNVYMATSKTKTKAKTKNIKDLEKNEAKKIINKKLAESCKGSAIILDGRKRCTSKELVKNGWDKNKIFIPNFSSDYSYIKRYHKNTYNMSLNEFIKKLKPSIKMSMVYFDYMCSFHGNKDTIPSEDIELLFSKGIIKKKGTFALTNSLSRFKKNKTPFTNKETIEIITEVEKIMDKYDYRFRLTPDGGVYNNGGNMCSLIWRG